TGISRGQWSSSQIFLVQSRVYAINLLFATVVLVLQLYLRRKQSLSVMIKKYESTEQLVAKGLFPGAVALPEPSRASQSPAAFECSQALEGTPPLFSEVRRDSLCPHDG